MNFNSLDSGLRMTHRYANRTQRVAAGNASAAEKEGAKEKRIVAEKASFMGSLQGAEKSEAEQSETEQIEAYRRYLQLKYGNVKIQSIGKDQKSLEQIGKKMSGNDVFIAPNILGEMANDPEKAAYYEQKIDYFFKEIIPRETAVCAAKGLVFEPGGVVVHEDGSVTYICGCSDSPERVAEVNAINKAKREKQAKQRKDSLERSQEAARQRKHMMELYYRRHNKAEIVANHLPAAAAFFNIGQSMPRSSIFSAIAAYEDAVNNFQEPYI